MKIVKSFFRDVFIEGKMFRLPIAIGYIAVDWDGTMHGLGSYPALGEQGHWEVPVGSLCIPLCRVQDFGSHKEALWEIHSDGSCHCLR